MQQQTAGYETVLKFCLHSFFRALHPTEQNEFFQGPLGPRQYPVLYIKPDQVVHNQIMWNSFPDHTKSN